MVIIESRTPNNDTKDINETFTYNQNYLFTYKIYIKMKSAQKHLVLKIIKQELLIRNLGFSLKNHSG